MNVQCMIEYEITRIMSYHPKGDEASKRGWDFYCKYWGSDHGGFYFINKNMWLIWMFQFQCFGVFE